MDKNTTKHTLTCSVNQLLKHCATVDLDSLDAEIEEENLINEIMAETGNERHEVIAALEQASIDQENELAQALRELVEEGKVIVSYDDDGTERYHAVE